MSRRKNPSPRKYCVELAPDEPLVFAAGYDEAILGIAWREGVPVVAYSTNAILATLCRRDRMKRDEAQEFFDFNILGAWVGEQTPFFVQLITPNRP